MTTAKIGDDDQKEISGKSDIVAIPSFQLRSTAVYSPPHGDRVVSGRRDLTEIDITNTDISKFKYYFPENRSMPTVRSHLFLSIYILNFENKIFCWSIS